MAYESTRKYVMPSKEELEALLERTGGSTAASKEFGCSRATIQRWAHKLDVHLPANKGGGLNRKRGEMLTSSVPTKVFGPVLRKIIDDYEMSPIMGSGLTKKGDFKSGKLYILFHENMPEQYKVPARTVSAILAQERPGVTFKTADKILCWLNHNYMWHSEPLNQFYWEGKPPPDNIAAIANGLAELARGA